MAKITQFSGLISNADPHDIPRDAAQSISNMCSRKEGCLQVRHGIKLHKSPLAGDLDDPTVDFSFMYPYTSGGSQYVLCVTYALDMYYVAL